MSSIYRLICVSHDPALIVEESEWQSLNEAAGAVMRALDSGIMGARDRAFGEHANCRLLLGRFSYPLIEVACLPSADHARSHLDIRWVDADWLRLLLAASKSIPQDPAVTKLVSRCWNADLLRRLEVHL